MSYLPALPPDIIARTELAQTERLRQQLLEVEMNGGELHPMKDVIAVFVEAQRKGFDLARLSNQTIINMGAEAGWWAKDAKPIVPYHQALGELQAQTGGGWVLMI